MATSFFSPLARRFLLGMALAVPFIAVPSFAQSLPPLENAAPPTAPNPIMLPALGGPAVPVVYDWSGKPKIDAADDGNAPDAAGGGDSPSDRAPVKKALTYFLYDFFAPARQIIQARHAALKRAYEQAGTSPAAAANGNAALGGVVNGATAAGGSTLASASADSGSLQSLGSLPNASALPTDPSQLTQDQYQQLLAARHGHTDAAPADIGALKAEATALPVNPNLTSASAPDAASDPQAADVVSANNPGSIDAFSDVADPLTQLSRNVTTSIPPDYQLGPGDALTVRYWSATRPPQEFSPTLDAQGAVLLEGGRHTVLRGVTTAQAETILRQQLGHLYRGVQVSVSLKELRTISVTVSGSAFAPGTYVVPCVATVFNVLYAAGGPSDDGTLRDVEVHRRGKLVATLDVYKFVTVGAQAGDVSLQSGDILYIPPRITQVTVAGEVRHPAIFELKENETLQDALKFAGGVKPSGVAQRIQISTLDPGAARVLRDVDLHGIKAQAVPLYDGDAVEVFSVRDTLMNRVTIEGAVDQPGDYAIAAGMRVSDLLAKARGPLDDAFLTRADLYRWNPDNTTTLIPVNLEQSLAGDPTANVTLSRWDRLKVYHRDDVAWIGHRRIEVRGAVQKPGIYQRSDNMHVSDLLRMTGGLTPDAYQGRAVLLHQHGDGTFAYDFVQLSDALAGNTAADLPVQDDDVLAVYRVGEAQFTPDKTVSIYGEVIAAGNYPRGEGMHLNDLLKLAGGLKPGASAQVSIAHARLFTSDVEAKAIPIRVASDSHGYCVAEQDPVLVDGDVVTVQGTDGFKSHVEVVNVQGAVMHPGPVVLDTDDMRVTDAIQKAGGLAPEAFVEGTQFARTPALIGTAGQHSLAQVISRLNDVLNQSDYQRQQAISDIERIKATSNASQPAQSPLAGIGGGTADVTTANPAGAVLATQLSKHDLVTAPRVLNSDELEADGNVAIDLESALRHPRGADDIKLMEGDTITIPERPTTVQVVGAVTTARAVLYHSGSGVEYYVMNSGGFTTDAAKDRIVVIHLGGGLIPANKAGALRPGDVIVVPTKVMADKLSNDKSSHGIDTVFKSITSSAITYRLATALFGL